MADSSAQERIDGIIGGTMAPSLREMGYRKVARTWSILEGDLIKIVNVQLSRNNTQAVAKFTLNLGVYHAAFHALRNPLDSTPEEPKQVRESDCDVRMRIGGLMGVHDYWWTVGGEVEDEKVRENLLFNFQKYGPAWLGLFRDLADLYRYFVDQSSHFDAALAAHLLGRGDVMSHLKVARKKANPVFVKYVEQWAEQHGYVL